MRFEKFYKEECLEGLKKELGLSNFMEVPRLGKVIVSSCSSEATQDSKVLDRVSDELAVITGQKPAITRAKKSIATFKLREGMPLGCKVTLRGKQMYEFLFRLINIAFPRTRDFSGISPKGFDGHGNYTVGIREQIIFPEINYDKIDKTRGFNVTITTTAQTDDEGRALLKKIGMPFREH